MEAKIVGVCRDCGKWAFLIRQRDRFGDSYTTCQKCIDEEEWNVMYAEEQLRRGE